MHKPSGSKGMTLVELIVATALLVMLIMAAVSFYYYGINTYSTGEELAQVQRNVRLAEYIITEEFRTANGITATSPSDGYKGISVGSSRLAVFFAATPSSLLNTVELIQNVSITFKDVSGSAVLEYNITGASKSQIYTLSGKLHLANLSISGSKVDEVDIGIQFNLDSVVLYYKKPL